jgi:solute:Na+ symporter, SSS family
MAANGAQYGVATVHFYWIGAIPAMVFLGVVMMPFYYGSKVRSVPEWLRRRYNKPTLSERDAPDGTAPAGLDE